MNKGAAAVKCIWKMIKNACKHDLIDIHNKSVNLKVSMISFLAQNQNINRKSREYESD